MRALALAIALALPVAAAARELGPIGSFRDVASNDGGEHCGGYSVSLWKTGGHVIGLLDVHSGLCGDPPCGAIADAQLDPATNALRFSSTVSGRRLRFEGKLQSRELTGRIDGKRVTLRADETQEAEWNGSVEAWCGFWRGVRRCEGVRELCATLLPSH